MKKIFTLAAALFSAVAVFAQGQAPIATPDVRSVVDPQFAPFYHGVASGDPLSDRVILWTRVSDQTAPSVTVNWEIDTDTLFVNPINSGTATADSASDYCVKVDATGLQPNTYYYYRFTLGNRFSLIGRTRTLPVGDADSLRLVLMSCQSYEAGYYNAHAALVNRNDFDAVVFVGDYIYEYGAFGNVRPTEPNYEILSLSDYRIRHSIYKLDPNLRRCHQQYPWFCVWDDHEITNDGWFGGAENHTDGVEGNWVNRRAWALKTYFDWMPVRMPDPQNDPQRIYREFRWGNLGNILMLDTRFQARDVQTNATVANNDTNRTILGAQQREWLINQMDTSTCKWQILGNQVMMGRLRIFGQSINLDQWDGYPFDRQRVFDGIANGEVENVVVLTGDIHTGWAIDLPRNIANYDAQNGVGNVGVEFVCNSVTSGNAGLELLNTVGTGVVTSQNPPIKYVDLAGHGYVLVDFNKTRTQGDYYNAATIETDNNPAETLVQSWYTLDGENFLRQAQTPTVRATPNPYLAPFTPANPVGVNEQTGNLAFFGAYPNPVQNTLSTQFYLNSPAKVTFEAVDVLGKTVATRNVGYLGKGVQYTDFDLSTLPAGTYIFKVTADKEVFTKYIIKK